jgi:hypothetical protein
MRLDDHSIGVEVVVFGRVGGDVGVEVVVSVGLAATLALTLWGSGRS